MSKLAEAIREFFDALFPASRRWENRYVLHLETEVKRLERERDVLSAKVERMTLAIMPLSSMAGVAVAAGEKPKEHLPVSNTEATLSFPRELSWQEIQADHERWMDEEDAKEKTATAAKE